jgi:hypothetical protein
MEKTYYLPKADAERLTWVTNFNNKLIGTTGYGATLGLTPAQLLYILNGIKMLTYIFAMITVAEKFYHSCISFKDSLNGAAIGTVAQAIPVFTPPPGVPTTIVPFGFYAWIMALVANIKTNAAYTVAMGTDLDIIGTEIVANWTTAQPTKVKVVSTAGNVKGSYLKGQAGGARIESKRASETAFTFLTNVTKASFIDSRPNVVPGTPETRQYRIWYLLDDVVVGIVSVIVTITVND